MANFLPNSTRKVLRTTLHVLIVHFTIFVFGCKEKELLFSEIEVSSIQFSGASITTIEDKGNELYLTVPYGTNLQALIPQFSVTLGGRGSTSFRESL